MNESDFENIIIKHPELIEEGLIFLGRQVHLEGKYLDLLFQDKNGQKVIVELKLIAKRKDIAQLIDYAGYFIDDIQTPIRTLLVANLVPENFKKSMPRIGLEYKEVSTKSLEQFLNKEDMIKHPISNLKTNFVEINLTKNSEVRNITRQQIAGRLKRGNIAGQARIAFLLLKDNPNKIFTMKDIIDYMKSNGYKSKSYYDLFNAFKDADLIKYTSVQGKKAYQLKE